ncbi:hypothetical protein ACEF96_004392 [Salmonella enterica]|nr:hypothetical protein [Salmonella enterica]
MRFAQKPQQAPGPFRSRSRITIFIFRLIYALTGCHPELSDALRPLSLTTSPWEPDRMNAVVAMPVNWLRCYFIFLSSRKAKAPAGARA